jgi:hypothetical protein
MKIRSPRTGLGILVGVVILVLALPAGAEASTNRYGAIAHSLSQNGYARGWAVSSVSLDAAINQALNICSSGGANDCHLDIAVTNSAAAVSISTPNGPYGTGIAPTRAGAANWASYYCRFYGGGNYCHLIDTIDATYVP